MVVSSGRANVTLLRAVERPGVGRRSVDGLTKAEGGGDAAGRPLRGGTVTTMSGGDRQGLRRSVETTFRIDGLDIGNEPELRVKRHQAYQ